MSTSNKISTKPSTQNENFESLNYIEFYGGTEILATLIHYYSETLFYNNLNLSVLRKSILKKLDLKQLTQENIVSTKMQNSTIFIYLDSGENIQISIDSLKQDRQREILGNTSKQKTQENVKKLQNAIEQIYSNNSGYIYNSEINNEDKIDIEGFGENLNLLEIKKLLDKESSKLKKIYKITGESQEYIALLKTELKFYVGIGDKYEGAARYFSMNQKQIDQKVRKLSNTMSVADLIEYIKHSNKQIENNYKKSQMVNQVNTKFINSLCKATFDKLKKQNASNTYFINFAKAVTGRGNLKIYSYEEYNKKDSFNYQDLEIDDSYKQIDMANKALIFVMYRKNGILEKLKKTKLKDFKIQDEEIGNKKPKQILSEFKTQLGKINKNDPNYAQNILIKSGFDSLIGTQKEYNKLNFDEKVSLGAIARITKILKDASSEDIQNPDFIKEKVLKTTKESFEHLNDSFSDNLDGWGGIFGKDAKELGLTGEFAEIFDLYQDINGNSGLFDLGDKTKDSYIISLPTATILGVGIIAGAIILGPFLVGAATISTGALFIAGAKLGAVVGVTSAIVQTQGYDTQQEAIVDISSQIGVDSLLTGAFTMVGLPVVAKYGNINPDLIFSKAAWATKSGLADKGFIGGEIAFTGMIASPTVSHIVKQWYPENHFDTDKTSYHEQLEKQKLDK